MSHRIIETLVWLENNLINSNDIYKSMYSIPIIP